jgi:hypothetical protein
VAGRPYYLLAIDRDFGDLGIPESRLQQIGWTKLALIGPHLSETNKELLLASAEKHTVKELELLMQGEVPVPDTRFVVFYLNPGDYERFAKLLRKNGAVKSGRGLFNKEKALMKVVTAAEQQATS